tara:strand:+ start:598 stop:1020 length:423 start_codon:yes stop_codon:yes gene_type:complete
MDIDSKYLKNSGSTLDHFVDDNGILFAGNHYLIDMWDCLYLEDKKKVKDLLIRAAKVAGATVLQIKVHHFGEGQGVSGVAILAESHISIHTWPERNFAAFDIFMCGSTNPELSLNFLKKEFNAKKVDVKKLKRGLINYIK